jgi:hypothetical protein
MSFTRIFHCFSAAAHDYFDLCEIRSPSMQDAALQQFPIFRPASRNSQAELLNLF